MDTNISSVNSSLSASRHPKLTYVADYHYADLNWTGIPCRTSVWYSYYVGGISTTALCSFAIFGNIICIIVLSRPVMKSSVNFILLALSCSDLIQVIATLLMRGIHRILEHHCTGFIFTRWIHPIIIPYLFPLGTTAQVAAVYLTVLVSIERYVAVCQPFKARIWFSWRKSSLFCLGVVFFSFLYNFPTWFELYTSASFNGDQFYGLIARRTALYRDANYVFYYVNLGSFLFIRLIPFTILVVLNSCIYRAICLMNRKRKTMTHFQCHEISIARMLLCIVFVFLLCNLITIISHFLEAFGMDHPELLQSASNFLVLLSAGLNFIIYCFLSRNFRKVLLRLLGATWDPTDFRGRSTQSQTSRVGSLIRQLRLGKKWPHRPAPTPTATTNVATAAEPQPGTSRTSRISHP